MDFTPITYTSLLKSLLSEKFAFQSFKDFILSPSPKVVVLRHDVDAKPANALRFARLQNEMGIVGTYYFRTVKKSYNKRIILEIACLGHEIGYHYETMDTCNGNVDKAYSEFCKNLDEFRKLTPVETISMHGSPMSPYDNRAIWKKYDYKKLGIIAEPYFDINFNELFYITDTGRCWDGNLYNLRDKPTIENPLTNVDYLRLRFHNTKGIIQAINKGSFPLQAMLNFHPQRWNDAMFPWMKELILQNIKNQMKRLLLIARK